MLNSFDKIEPVNFIHDWVTTEEELNQVKQVLPDNDAKQIRTIQDLINYINPSANQEEIRKLHRIKMFW